MSEIKDIFNEKLPSGHNLENEQRIVSYLMRNTNYFQGTISLIMRK